MVTIWSPFLPFILLSIPFPDNLSFVPLWIPEGTFKFTRPYNVLISIVAPKAAWLKVIGKSNKMLFPSLSKISCFLTFTCINKSPEEPPLTPASPSPESLIVWSSAIPAGILILRVLVFLTYYLLFYT